MNAIINKNICLAKQISKENNLPKMLVCEEKKINLGLKLNGYNFFEGNLARNFISKFNLLTSNKSFADDYQRYLNEKLTEIFPEKAVKTHKERLLKSAYLQIAEEKAKGIKEGKLKKIEDMTIKVEEVFDRYEALYARCYIKSSGKIITFEQWNELKKLAKEKGFDDKPDTLLKLVDMYQDYEKIKGELSNEKESLESFSKEMKQHSDNKNKFKDCISEVNKIFYSESLTNSAGHKISIEDFNELKELTTESELEMLNDIYKQFETLKIKDEFSNYENEIESPKNVFIEEDDDSEDEESIDDFKELFKKFEDLKKKDNIFVEEKDLEFQEEFYIEPAFEDEKISVNKISAKEFKALKKLAEKRVINCDDKALRDLCDLYLDYKMVKEELILIQDEDEGAYSFSSGLEDYALGNISDFNDGWEDIMLLLDHLQIDGAERRSLIYTQIVGLENDVIHCLLSKEKFSSKDMGRTQYNAAKLIAAEKKTILKELLKLQKDNQLGNIKLKIFLNNRIEQAKQTIIKSCKEEKEQYDFLDKRMKDIELDIRIELKEKFTEEDLANFENDHCIYRVTEDLRDLINPFPDSYDFKNLSEFNRFIDEAYLLNKEVMLKVATEFISTNLQYYKHLSKENIELIEAGVRKISKGVVEELTKSTEYENDDGFMEVKEGKFNQKDLNALRHDLARELKSVKSILIKESKLLKTIDNETIGNLISKRMQDLQNEVIDSMLRIKNSSKLKN